MIQQKRARCRGNPPELVTVKEFGTLKLIKSQKDCKLLGGTFQDNLAWNYHIDSEPDVLVPERN